MNSRFEAFRPQYHFTPARNWMNDPNGLVFFAGEYHLFFQYNPFGEQGDHLSWGHAVSPDLVHWTELPVAIPEKDGVMAFSGSAVVDWSNTSGFGDGLAPPLVAIFTGHRPATGHQSQYLAYSRDRGRTWQTYAGNPVLDIGSKEFRDPKVFWYAPGGYWVMAVVMVLDRQVALYRSPDLKAWTLLSRFGPAGSTTGAWECPDLFPLAAPGGALRWVLVVSVNDAAPAGGSGTQYFVGDFDGTRFTADPHAGRIPTCWLDWGRDSYAAVTWSDVPASDGRRLLLAWMNNWKYASGLPTSPWRSAQGLVRELSLRETPEGLRLCQLPAVEYQRLRQPNPTVLRDQPLLAGKLSVAAAPGADVAEIAIEFELGQATEVGLELGAGPEVARIRYEAAGAVLSFERPTGACTAAGFAGIHRAVVPAKRGRVALRIFIDRSLVEVFADGGLVSLSDQVFLADGCGALTLYAQGGAAKIVDFQRWLLNSARS